MEPNALSLKADLVFKALVSDRFTSDEDDNPIYGSLTILLANDPHYLHPYFVPHHISLSEYYGMYRNFYYDLLQIMLDSTEDELLLEGEEDEAAGPYMFSEIGLLLCSLGIYFSYSEHNTEDDEDILKFINLQS
jgi:hypothetical protein